MTSRGSRAALAIFGLILTTIICAPMLAATQRRPNIILIVMDTVRFDATSSESQFGSATPFLSSLSSHSVVFTNAFSTHDFTPTSHFSLMTGLWDGLGTDEDRVENGIAWQLKRSGYSTFAVVANRLLAVEQMPTMRGFEHFNRLDGTDRSWIDSMNELVSIDERLARFGCRRTDGARSLLYHSADRLLPKFLEEIRTAKRPYFGFVNLLDAHEPYVPNPATYTPEKKLPPNFDGDLLKRRVPDELLHPETISDPVRRKHIKDELRLVKFPRLLSDDLPPEALAIYHRRYLAKIRDLDAALQKFFEEMQREHLLDNAIVIITSDHGESFGEAGFVTHMLGDHGDQSATHHVPLIVVLPPSLHRETAVVDRVVSLDMIAPTVYDLAGIDFEPFRRRFRNYPPSLVSLITPATRRVATAFVPSPAQQENQKTLAERQKTMQSLGYIH
jgi:arylsulfatase A-like enzyme